MLNPADFGYGTRVSALIELAARDDTDLLDDYIEAHVHGPVDLAKDVEALVLDPSHRGAEFVELGRALAEDGHLDPQALKRVWHYVARFGALP